MNPHRPNFYHAIVELVKDDDLNADDKIDFINDVGSILSKVNHGLHCGYSPTELMDEIMSGEP